MIILNIINIIDIVEKDHFTVVGDNIIFEEHYNGSITIPINVTQNGEVDEDENSIPSNTVNYILDVLPVPDAPEIISYTGPSEFNEDMTISLNSIIDLLEKTHILLLL